MLKMKTLKQIVSFTIVITLLLVIPLPKIVVADEILISDYDVFTKYPNALANDNAKYIEKIVREQVLETLSEYDGWWESFVTEYKKTLPDWSEVHAREIAGIYNKNYSNYGELREQFVQQWMLNIANVEDISVSKIAGNALYVYENIFKDSFMLTEPAEREMFSEQLNAMNFTNEQIASVVNTVYKDIDTVNELIEKVDFAVELSDAIAVSIMTKDVQVELLDTILMYLPQGSELYSDLYEQRERIISSYLEDIVKDLLENGIVEKLSDFMKSHSKGSISANPSEFNSWVANVSLELTAKVVQGASADDVVKASMLVGIMANLDKAILDLKIKFLNGTYSQIDLDAYPIVYEAYISTVRAALEQAEKIEKKSERKSILDSHITIWNKYTYSRYMEFCKDAAKLQMTSRTLKNAISPSYDSIYVIKQDGNLWSWSGGESNQVLTDVNMVKGDYAITNNGELWGLNNIKTPNPVRIMSDVADITVYPGGMETRNYMGILKKDGSLWVTQYSQELDEPTLLRIVDSGVVSVETGGDFLMVLKDDATLWIWDEPPNDEGTNMKRVVKIMEDVSQIGLDNPGVALAIKKDRSLWAWSYAQYAWDGISQEIPASIKVMEGAYEIFNWSNFMIDADNNLWYFDFDFEEDMSISSFTNSKILDNVKQVFGRSYSGTAIKYDETIWEWGYDSEPQQVGENIRHIEGGLFYFIYVGSDNSIWAFGRGLPKMEFSENPIPVKIFDDITLENDSKNLSNTEPSSSKPFSWVDAKLNTGIHPYAWAEIRVNTLTKPSSWAEEQVNTAIETGLVPKSLQKKYTETTTRAEFCALAIAMYEAVMEIEIIDRKTFDDTNDVNVEKAAAIGIVSGMGHNKFEPNTKMNREQAAVMLSRLADVIGKPLPKQAVVFADKRSIAEWAIEGVGQVQAAGIMSGVGNNAFAPKSLYTREQSIVTIIRLYEFIMQ